MSQQSTVDFNCPECSKKIRVPANLVGAHVQCPICQQVVVAGASERPQTARAIPVKDDGESLPSLESLQNTTDATSPKITLPDELASNVAQMPASPVANSELSNLIDGVLEQAPDAPKDDPTAPIKFDDHDEMYGADDIIGITCNVCDTRIHVRRDQIGGTVECPDCLVQVQIHDPKTRKKHWGRGGLTAPESRQTESENRSDPARPNPTIGGKQEAQSNASIKQSGGGAAALPSLDELELLPSNDAMSEPNSPNIGAEPAVPQAAGEELRLSDPVELPPAEVPIGLDPVDVDMLAPQLAPPRPLQTPQMETPAPATTLNSEVEDLRLEPLDDSTPTNTPPIQVAPVVEAPRDGQSPAPMVVPSIPTAAPVSQPVPVVAPVTGAEAVPKPKSQTTKPKNQTKKSRKERLAEAQESSNDQPGDPVPFELPEKEQDFPEFTHTGLVPAVKDMLLSPSLWWLSAIAMALMIGGAIVRIRVFPPGFDLATAENFGQFLGNAVMAILLGATPYFVGLFLLWLLASFMFRDAALGRRKVKSWGFAGFGEIQGTFLLFAFSFFVAGLVAVFFQPLMIPLRMLLAPLFLASAFFSRNVWGLVAVDIFSNFGKLQSQWLTLYVWMFALSGFGLLAGFLFWLRGPDMAMANSVMTVFGVILNSIVTLVFAPIAGWHAGLICRDLQKD